MSKTKSSARRATPRKRPSAEALEIGRRANKLPSTVQARLAKVAKAGEVDTYSDHTGPRIHAFLASVRPLDVELADQESFEAGRFAVYQMAMVSKGIDVPGVIFPLSTCADVLNFLSCIRPVEPHDWWKDPKNAPSHVCGLAKVLETLEASLRRRCES